MEILHNLFYFIIALGVLVLIHEWGHYMAAKLTGMRSDIFSFGMGRRLLGWNKKTGFSFGQLAKDHEYDGETDWRISLFPVGGYVKIVGMVDESFDTNFKEKKAESYEFRSKNTFQKLFVLSAGVLMNFVLAMAIFSYITFKEGKNELSTTEVAYVHQDSFFKDYDLQSGDNILEIDGKEVKSWHEVLKFLVFDDLGSDKSILIERNGKKHELLVGGEELSSLINENAKEEKFGSFLGLDSKHIKVFIRSVLTDSPADKAGLQAGDTILYLGRNEIVSQWQFIDIIKEANKSAIDITWKRNDRIYNSTIKADRDNKIGVYHWNSYVGPINTIEFGFFESIELGIKETFSQLVMIINSFGEIFKGNIDFKNAVGGPVKIMEQSGKTAEMGFEVYLSFVAMLSISLALINILPIPALDGGHLLIVLIEGLRRKELNIKTKLIVQNIGFYLLIILMIVILYIDFTR